MVRGSRVMALMRGLVVVVALLAPVGLLAAPPAAAQMGTVKVEFFGHSFFRFTSPSGKVVLTNPWINGNPSVTVSLDDITQADMILVPNGHGDEMGQAAEIAIKTGAMVIASGELHRYMTDAGVPTAQVPRFATPGDRYRKDGITVRLLASDHGSGVSAPSAAMPYGGQASSFMVTFENGYTIYHMASSPMRSEMALWGSMYKPDLMIFHMSSSHEPLDIAMAVKLMMTDNPNLQTLMWHHNVPEPPATGTTVAEVQSVLGAMGIGIPITNQVRSQVYEFSK
ncbi:MAG: MBL fold metallo-hydrolase [Chloroflexota bacterium]